MMSKNTQFTEPDPLSAAVLKEAREERKLLAESQARVAELEAGVQTLRNTSVALLDCAEKAEAHITDLEDEIEQAARQETAYSESLTMAEADNVSLRAALEECKGADERRIEMERDIGREAYAAFTGFICGALFVLWMLAP